MWADLLSPLVYFFSTAGFLSLAGHGLLHGYQISWYPHEDKLVGSYEAGETRTQIVFSGWDGGWSTRLHSSVLVWVSAPAFPG